MDQSSCTTEQRAQLSCTVKFILEVVHVVVGLINAFLLTGVEKKRVYPDVKFTHRPEDAALYLDTYGICKVIAQEMISHSREMSAT